jgi:hypothetical protein
MPCSPRKHRTFQVVSALCIVICPRWSLAVMRTWPLHSFTLSYWTRIFPHHFELVPVPGAERFFLRIAFVRVVDPLRPRALVAFEEFFFLRAGDVYPRYDFARMNDNEYRASLDL